MQTEKEGCGLGVTWKTQAEIASASSSQSEMTSYEDQIPGGSFLTSLVRLPSVIPKQALVPSDQEGERRQSNASLSSSTELHAEPVHRERHLV